jgi:MoxR-like ATPase
MEDVRQELSKVAANSKAKFDRAKLEIGKVIVGQQNLIDRLFIALLADGHILLEGVPGLAKTLAVTTLSKVIECESRRIQFTPDLLPADLIGTSIYHPQTGQFTVKKGPIFTNILLADEINRAPAKVQSALLEIMAERQVTIGGETFETGAPFLVLATQNPIEHTGTYSLPEAQMDRFMMKVKIHYPTSEDEKEIILRMGKLSGLPQVSPVLTKIDILDARKLVDQVYIDDKIIDFILQVVFATREPKRFGINIEGLLDYGASPRASLFLKFAAKAHAFLAGRGYVTPYDIKNVAHDVLRHRLHLSYEAEAENISADEIIDRIFEKIQVP